ncbi:MAG: recombinase family protein [Thermoleophilaceae bacterium]|nr:recombinase family protein [Thermoleophilaceae bacterium]
MLEKGMSLEEIAENLNDKGIRRPHGSATWSATSVRKRSFLSNGAWPRAGAQRGPDKPRRHS